MRWLRCGEEGGRCGLGVLLLAGTLLLGGCVGAVPLPGIKTGRAVDERTALQILPGTTYAEVILRYGEPDSVSVDGRTIAYRYARLWGAAWLVAQNGAGLATGIDYGEALVVAFDEQNRVVRAERKKAGWFKERASDEILFPPIATSQVPDGEPVDARWATRLWTTEINLHEPPVPVTQLLPCSEPRRFLVAANPVGSGGAGLQPGVLQGTGGTAILSGDKLWVCPAWAGAAVTAPARRITADEVRGVTILDEGTLRERVGVLLEDDLLLMVITPDLRAEPIEREAWLRWLGRARTAAAGTGAGEARRLPSTGWTGLIGSGWPVVPRFGHVWIFGDGIGLESVDDLFSAGPLKHRFIPWTAIRELSFAPSLLCDWKAVLHLSDGSKLELSGLKNIPAAPKAVSVPVVLGRAWAEHRGTRPGIGDNLPPRPALEP